MLVRILLLRWLQRWLQHPLYSRTIRIIHISWYMVPPLSSNLQGIGVGSIVPAVQMLQNSTTQPVIGMSLCGVVHGCILQLAIHHT
uniref:Uncharacterized protein n=1 Tax=Arundo donax TaxID=35708 RepID=A0A0A9DJ06_ARUDO